MEGRAIDTIGYRGMHSYEIALSDWFVAAENQVGGEDGLGKGFYYQMEGFENGRLQTAARAVGVMQAAYEEARQYAEERSVFGRPIAEYQLTQVKLTRMAVTIQAARQSSYVVAKLMAEGEGALEASMVKAYVCKAAEWVTREAMQIHGGMGYAEEYPVSRYFVDARVLSIFEGADETLCLKVIARRLLGKTVTLGARQPFGLLSSFGCAETSLAPRWSRELELCPLRAIRAGAAAPTGRRWRRRRPGPGGRCRRAGSRSSGRRP